MKIGFGSEEKLFKGKDGGALWKWSAMFLLVFGFFVPILGGLVTAPPPWQSVNISLVDLNLTNTTLGGGTVLEEHLNASGFPIRDAVLVNATLAGGAVFAGDVDARGYRFLNAVVYNGTLAGGTVFADVVDARGYRLKNAVLDNGTLTNGTVFADAVDARGYQLKNAVIYNGTLTGGTIFAGDVNASGYRLSDAVLENTTLVSAVVGVGPLNMDGKTLSNVDAIEAKAGVNVHIKAASGQCFIVQNGSAGQMWASCDGATVNWPAGTVAQFRGHVEAESNNSYNLGHQDRKWKTIYAVGTNFGDVNIDDVAVIRGSGDTLSFYSYDPQTKKLVEKVMELNLATGDLSVKGKIHEKASFAPLTEEEKRTPFEE